MTEDDVQKLWLYAAEKWDTFVLPDDDDLLDVRMLVWQDHLGDLDPRYVRAALVAADRSRFCPSVGEMRHQALELILAERGVPRTPDADEAWAEVMAGVRRYGRRQTPTFMHPLIGDVVRGVGWSHICGSENVDVLRGQFRKAYDAARLRYDADLFPPPPALTGVTQRSLPQPDRLPRPLMSRHDQG